MQPNDLNLVPADKTRYPKRPTNWKPKSLASAYWQELSRFRGVVLRAVRVVRAQFPEGSRRYQRVSAERPCASCSPRWP